MRAEPGRQCKAPRAGDRDGHRRTTPEFLSTSRIGPNQGSFARFFPEPPGCRRKGEVFPGSLLDLDANAAAKAFSDPWLRVWRIAFPTRLVVVSANQSLTRADYGWPAVVLLPPAGLDPIGTRRKPWDLWRRRCLLTEECDGSLNMFGRQQRRRATSSSA